MMLVVAVAIVAAVEAVLGVLNTCPTEMLGLGQHRSRTLQQQTVGMAALAQAAALLLAQRSCRTLRPREPKPVPRHREAL